ncbi:hypothetical protein JB92DRAFT_2870066 [Gautieria morchelliformis]|nr:hypothetical protein JB92DRAFT_2870066 [Gautieria morchelliformis]
MSLKLDTLPNDVLIRVFKELDACDIRRCSLTCRVFHKTIRDSMLLQYRLELGVAGLEEGGTDCRLSIAERLARLRTLERGWANLYYRRYFTATLPHNPTWKLRGGVLARGFTNMPSVLSFIQLPSAVRGTSVHTWHSDMKVNMIQFSIDPAQDLVVLVAWPETPDGQWHTFLIHLRAMSTGARHPCAAEPVLSCVPTLLDTQYDFSIQIMGDFLAVLYRTPAGYLMDLLYLWDWKTGQLLISLEASSLATDILGFSFLSSRRFITVRCTSEPDGCYQPELVVYDFIAARLEGSMEPRLVRIYQLPRLPAHTHTRWFILGSEPPSELPTSFYPTSCSRLLTVSMHFTYFLEEDRYECDYVLFVHASTLLEEVDARSNAEQLTVPWENWGPLKTRIMPMWDYRADCHVYGMRYVQQQVVPMHEDSACIADRYRLRRLDFNPLSLRRPLDTSLSSWQDEFTTIAIVQDSQPAILSGLECAFTQRVTTALPYREVIVRGRPRDGEVMIDRESVVHLGRDSWETARLEFLCI